MDPAITELNQKIDALTAQVAYLAEQARIAERSRQELEELVDVAKPIAHEAMHLASTQLEEVQAYVDLPDLLRLVKKLLRHGPQLEMLVDQIDGVTDLLELVGPLSKEVVGKLTSVMDEMEHKGYFAFVRGGMRLAENVVASFTEDDVNRLGDNIVLILNTVKDMTQPEIMSFVRSTLLIAEKEIEKPVDTSYLGLMRQMSDPAVRRGLALTVRVLHVVGSQADVKSSGA